MGTFGERLYDSMVIAGISDAALAGRCKVLERTVGIWLKSNRADVITGHELALAGLALGVSLRWLALEIGTPTPIGLMEARQAHAPE